MRKGTKKCRQQCLLASKLCVPRAAVVGCMRQCLMREGCNRKLIGLHAHLIAQGWRAAYAYPEAAICCCARIAYSGASIMLFVEQ